VGQWGRARVNPKKGKLVETIRKVKELRRVLLQKQTENLEELEEVHRKIKAQRKEYEKVHGDG
jgi:hypothetical protein